MIQDIKFVTVVIRGKMIPNGAMGIKTPDQQDTKLLVKINDEWQDIREETVFDDIVASEMP